MRAADQPQGGCPVLPGHVYGRGMTDPKETALNVVKSPLAQAVGVGSLALIPARKYPAWLRQTLTWGSTAASVGLIALPKSKTPARKTSPEEGQTEQGSRPTMSPVARTGVAAGVGAAVYGSWKFTWWFDNAAEQALRTLRVPLPRAVMGAACGAWFYRMETETRQQISAHSQTSGGDAPDNRPRPNCPAAQR